MRHREELGAMAVVAVAYIARQTVVDTWGE